MKRLRVFHALLLALLVFAGASVAETAYSQTTGLPVKEDREYLPILVQMKGVDKENIHYGLAKADIVYESIYYAPGWTSLLAVYNDNYPAQVGPVRAARPYHGEIALSWDGLYLFYGEQPSLGDGKLYNVFKEHAFEPWRRGDVTRGARDFAFFVSKDADPPSHYMVNLNQLSQKDWIDEMRSEGFVPRDPQLPFSSKPSTSSRAGNTVGLYFGENIGRILFQYDPKLSAYVRHVDGEVDFDQDTNEVITCKNVIVQCHTMQLGEVPPNAQSTNRLAYTMMYTAGTGPIRAFIDGNCIYGTWKRDSIEEPFTYYDANGNPLRLARGKTFIEMLPTEMFFSEDKLWGHDATFTNADLSWIRPAPK